MACRPQSYPPPVPTRVADAHPAGAAGDSAPARLGVPTPGSGAAVPGFPGRAARRRRTGRAFGFAARLPKPGGVRPRPAPPRERPERGNDTLDLQPRTPPAGLPLSAAFLSRPVEPAISSPGLPPPAFRAEERDLFAARRHPATPPAASRRRRGGPPPARGQQFADPRQPGPPPRRAAATAPLPRRRRRIPGVSPARSGVRAPRPAEEASPSADLALDEEFPAVAPRSGAHRGNGVAAAVVVAVRIPEAGPSRSGLRPRGEARSEPSAPLRGTRFHALPGVSPASPRRLPSLAGPDDALSPVQATKPRPPSSRRRSAAPAEPPPTAVLPRAPGPERRQSPSAGSAGPRSRTGGRDYALSGPHTR